ncbi:hypothetical protein C7999DRAFT_36759 [Corynascus novoguineensis]|uniref:Transcription initiation factor TFIID subunit 9B n=1 Tax=Corynascus novoguineensis TaxID=1126955 RepID=A0AAN7D2L0_9PEZI|nr:hypothetical protein C7999DRAFT_36759 [Corynascus novoguineensis]
MSSSGAAAPQTNGAPPSSATSTSQTTDTQQQQPPPTQQSQQPTGTSTGSATNSQQQQPQQQHQQQSQSQPQQQQQQQQYQSHHSHLQSLTQPIGGNGTNNPSTAGPRPRDARTIELLLTAQGVTAFEQRVPLLLLDFAYRHASSVLSDALHLSADPYTSHAGARPSAASGAAPVNVGDATVSANAVQLAIASRLGFQFHGGGGGGGGGAGGGAGAGGASKEWMMELARERNKIALPRVMPSEWGVRLPGERFVLSGVSWGLRDVWPGQEGMEESSEEEEGEDAEMVDRPNGSGADAKGADAMEVETEDVGGDGVEGGTIGDVFGDEGLEDEEMAEA